MKIHDLIILVGFNPDASPLRIWGYTLLGFLLFVPLSLVMLAYGDALEEPWPFLIIFSYATLWFLAGRTLGVIDEGTKRNGIRDLTALITGILKMQFGTKRAVRWNLIGFALWILVAGLIAAHILSGGNQASVLIIFPALLVVVFLVRHFGNF